MVSRRSWTGKPQASRPLHNLEGTLAYLSPEQTGRTTLEVDSRTDLYALGATLYHLLTGNPPFTDADIAQLLNAVLTRQPDLANLRAPSVPQALADIVAKLLQKAPDQRYQSAYGLLRDLQRCADALSAEGGIAGFALGAYDHRERLELPHKLYGRQQQAAALHSTYEKAAGGTRQLALVHGVSGAGKSSLVASLKPAMVQQQALFVSGKFDALRQHVPFTAFAQAIDDLIRQILASSKAGVDVWRSRIATAVGKLGQALIDIAPAAELLLGPQVRLPTLPPEQTENRLLRVLGRFMQCLCVTHPLVLFLDDLQWADAGTLKLLKEILAEAEPMAGLLVIGAYRGNEVGPAHAVTLFRQQLAQHFTAVTDVRNWGPRFGCSARACS